MGWIAFCGSIPCLWDPCRGVCLVESLSPLETLSCSSRSRNKHQPMVPPSSHAHELRVPSCGCKLQVAAERSLSLGKAQWVRSNGALGADGAVCAGAGEARVGRGWSHGALGTAKGKDGSGFTTGHTRLFVCRFRWHVVACARSWKSLIALHTQNGTGDTLRPIH